MNLMLAAVCLNDRNEVSLGFLTGLINFQTAFGQRNKGMLATIFHKDINDAINAFHKSDSEVLILADTMTPINWEFLLGNLDDMKQAKFVSAVHPFCGVDWDAVQKKHDAGSKEAPEYAGLTYNVKFDKNGPHTSNTHHVAVKESTLNVFMITKDVTDKIAKEAVITEDGTVHFWTPAFDAGKRLNPAANFMKMWGGPVWADIDRQLSAFGIMDFFGCVGLRHKLR